MKFWIGQRIKKVRGERNVGSIGVVEALCDYPAGTVVQFKDASPARLDRHIDLKVVMLTPWIARHSGKMQPVGSKCVTNSGDWEPELPPGLESPSDALELWEPDPAHTR